jgi:starch synthase
LIILGEGSPEFHEKLLALKQRFPTKLGLRIGFDEILAHRIEAGADFFLMPSRYEPSGLNQLYSLKYGTPPIVRRTGGLADTITDTYGATLISKKANGFCFDLFDVPSLKDAVERALAVYAKPAEYAQVQQNGMTQDWSWTRSAKEYELLYRQLILARKP